MRLSFVPSKPTRTAPAGGSGEPLRTRSTKAIDEVKARLTVPIQTWQAALFLFEEQWRQIRRYGQTRGLEIVGDLPLYVAWDSVDAWTHPELFQLTADGFPTFVAGCPPDAFSETGQRWGNPLYDWPRHQAEDFRWWLRRVQRNLDWVDSIRIDHFIGFSRYFSIPAQDEDARGGRWVEGPGAAFSMQSNPVSVTSPSGLKISAGRCNHRTA